MRIRRKPWARPELFACPFCINEEEKAAVAGHWQEQFAHPQPLWLELGCGKGQFMASLASSHPEINFIAIDIKSEVLVLAKRKIEAAYAKCQLPLDNIRILSQDIERISTLLLPQDQVERIYINFCNPWSQKAKHRKRRLTHPRQLEQYKTFLPPAGKSGLKPMTIPFLPILSTTLRSAGFPSATRPWTCITAALRATSPPNTKPCSLNRGFRSSFSLR